MYADDLVICVDDEKRLQKNVWKWQSCMEIGGLLLNTAKTEAMVSIKARENINVVDRLDNDLKQTEASKYLGSTLSEKGNCQAEVQARVNVAWCRCRQDKRPMYTTAWRDQCCYTVHRRERKKRMT